MMLNYSVFSFLAAIGPGGSESRAHDVAGISGADLRMTLHFIDFSILAIYIVVVIGIGFALKRYTKSAEDYLLSGRSIPGWITGLAFISANLGAQELIGMAASGAEYGIMTSHFYWVGAIPAMVFLGIFMMPMYYGSKAKSVPDYLKMRYDERTRTFNSFSFAVMTVFSSGISMHALADLLNFLLGWNYHVCLLVTSAIVLAYVLKGGLSSAIYNEVLQFFMIVLGIAPLAFLGLRDVGGWNGLVAKLAKTNPQAMHSWAGTSGVHNPLGIQWYGILFGLGFVLSFGYWCTNFAEVQRAMAANSMGAARRTPIIGAIPKMFFPAIIILPGMIAYALSSDAVAGGYSIPMKGGAPNYNETLPSMIFHYFPSGLLGLAMTAVMASFMSGMAANVTSFNTVVTYDIYQRGSKKTDSELLRMGKIATVAGILLAICCAYVAANYNNIMSILQLVFGFVNAPLFATFLLGMFTRRSNSTGSFWGLVIGTTSAVVFHGLSFAVGNAPGVKGAWIHPLVSFPKEMSQGFWVAIVAFSVTFLINLGLSIASGHRKPDEELRGLVYSLTPKEKTSEEPWYARPAILGAIVFVACVILNIIFW
jgi:SSS family solute:Na+ symporter